MDTLISVFSAKIWTMIGCNNTFKPKEFKYQNPIIKQEVIKKWNGQRFFYYMNMNRHRI